MFGKIIIKNKIIIVYKNGAIIKAALEFFLKTKTKTSKTIVKNVVKTNGFKLAIKTIEKNFSKTKYILLITTKTKK